jgi:hydroxymethylbilane synthase
VASIRIGTRGSPMALAQTHLVRDRLIAAHPDLAEPGAIEVRVIQTTGDKVQDRTLAAIGGKGLFTKEIEDGLLDGSLDMAVHSMKDVQTWLPEGLEIVCLLPRDDPRDGFISPKAKNLAALPAGSVIGTASLRRQAQILALRPDLKVVPFRGNANTRLRKLGEGQVDATLLAVCGLQRLGMPEVVTCTLSREEMLPAVAQGAIGVECRADDAAMRARLAPLHDRRTEICVTAERALLRVLDGSCRTPIAALAELGPGDRVNLAGLVIKPDGSVRYDATRSGAAADAEKLGADAGAELKRLAGPAFLDALT